jgi:hypothetical protein
MLQVLDAEIWISTCRMAGMHPFCTGVAAFIPSDLQIFASHWLIPSVSNCVTSPSPGEPIVPTTPEEILHDKIDGVDGIIPEMMSLAYL